MSGIDREIRREKAIARRVVLVMARRLALAELVAAAKWASRAAVHDEEQATAVVASAEVQALAWNLDPESVRNVFEDLVVAGESIESEAVRRWSSGEAATPPPPSLRIVRGELAALTPLILASLSHIRAVKMPRDEVQSYLGDAAIDEERRRGWSRVEADALWVLISRVDRFGE